VGTRPGRQGMQDGDHPAGEALTSSRR
jgi:hypothetical protein